MECHYSRKIVTLVSKHVKPHFKWHELGEGCMGGGMSLLTHSVTGLLLRYHATVGSTTSSVYTRYLIHRSVRGAGRWGQ